MRKGTVFLAYIVLLMFIITACATDKNNLLIQQKEEEQIETLESSGDLQNKDGNGNISSNDSENETLDDKNDVDDNFDEQKWVVYKSTDGGFSLKYPADYDVVEKKENIDGLIPSPFFEVKFKEQKSDLDALVVRVYDLPLNTDYEDWLMQSLILQRYGEGADIETYSLKKFDAYKVTSERLIYPRSGVYVKHPRHNLVYEFVVTENVGESIMKSFSVRELK